MNYMNISIKYLTLLILLFSTSFSFGQNEEKSPYSVGFKYYKTYDESRSYLLNDDTISRPLLIHFWYPTVSNLEESTYSFKNYIDLISLRQDFNSITSDTDKNSINFINAYAGFAKHNLGVDTSLSTEDILKSPVLAHYGADVAKSKKKFPLIIYAPSNSKSAVQNHIICEFLASNGYIVISVGSAGPNSLNRRNNPESIMAQVYDMEFILKYVKTNLKIKYDRLGLMGYSSGGLATSIFQMRNKKVKAVFSMDGSQEFGSYVSLSKVEDFNLKKANVPYCLVHNNYENFSIFPYYNSIASKDKYIFQMPYLDHNGFVSYWRFFDLCSTNSGYSKTCLSYDFINKTALEFFNKYLKTSSLFNDNSELNFQDSEYIKANISDNSLIAQFGNLILSDDSEAINRFMKEHHETLKIKETEINILAKMLRDSRMDDAIQLLLFNVKIHPNSWQAHFELGFTNKLKGELSLAKESLLKAKELNPENGEINKILKEINESQ